MSLPCAQPPFDLYGAFLYIFSESFLVIRQPQLKAGIPQAEDLYGQYGCVLRPSLTETRNGHRHPLGHLKHGIECINPTEDLINHRHTNNRYCGKRGKHPGQRRSTSCTGYDYRITFLFRTGGILMCKLRRPMARDHVYVKLKTKLL